MIKYVKFLVLAVVMFSAQPSLADYVEIHNQNGVSYKVDIDSVYIGDVFTSAMFKIHLPKAMKYDEAKQKIALPECMQLMRLDSLPSHLDYNEFYYTIAHKPGKLQTLKIIGYKYDGDKVTTIISEPASYNSVHWQDCDSEQAEVIENWFRKETKERSEH